VELDLANARTQNNLKMAQVAAAGKDARDAVATGTPESTGKAPDAVAATAQQSAAMPSGTAALPPRQAAIEAAAPPAATAPLPGSPRIAPMIASAAPQTGMEVVEVLPNVIELKMKNAIAPVVVERRTGEAAAATPARAAAGIAATSKPTVEIANGNGVAGMARRMKYVLLARGIAVSRLTNERPYKQQETKIQYRLGYEQEAEALKQALRGHAAMVAANKLSGRSSLRLVLGKDAIAHMALIERADDGSRLALRGEAD
jgi:hypothetical protein